MKILMATMVVSAALLTGCNKGQKDAKADSKAGTSEDNPINAPMNYLAAEAAAKKSSERVINLAPVHGAIQQFYAAEDRYPRSIDELVKSGYLGKVPQLPEGQGLYYNPNNGEYKVVPIVQNAPAPTGPRPKPSGATIGGLKSRIVQPNQQLPPE
ncbi:MAG TPA: hypothetical protein VMF06_18650 [Candidatus Limnocylindria bacterium]|nr:hypothetical protein [Candidatus Limnocylindria bacterium]